MLKVGSEGGQWEVVGSAAAPSAIAEKELQTRSISRCH
jgi:hypothetical protein